MLNRACMINVSPSAPPLVGRCVAKLASLLVAALVVGLTGGCEKGAGSSSAGGGGDAGQTSLDASKLKRPGSKFEFPAPDLASLHPASREDIEAAMKRAKEAPEDPASMGNLGMFMQAFNYTGEATSCYLQAIELDKKAFKKAQKAAEEDENATAPARDFRWPYLVGVMYQRAGLRGDAIEMFEQAVEINESYSPAILRLADLHLGVDNNEAKRYYEMAKSEAGSFAKAQAGLAACAKAAGNLADAIKLYQSSVDREPNDRAVVEALVAALKEAGQADEAKEYEEKAGAIEDPVKGYRNDILLADIEQKKENPRFLFDKAKRLFDENKLDECELLLKRALRMDRSFEEARKLRAKAYFLRNGPRLGKVYADMALAKELFLRVEQDKPDDVEARAYLGMIDVVQGKVQEGLDRLEGILEDHPDDPLALCFAGYGYAQKAKTLPKDDTEARKALMDRGRETLKRSVELNPDDAYAMGLYGLVQAYSGMIDEAIETMTKALDNGARLLVVARVLGDLHLSRQEYDEAVQCWKKAIEIQPYASRPYMQLVTRHLVLKEHKKALALASKALELIPNDPQLNNVAAWILATHPDDDVRDGARALRYAETACRATDYRVPLFLDTLAAAYAEVGRFDEAARMSGLAIEFTQRNLKKAEEEQNERETKNQTQLLQDYRARLELFQKNEPFRENLEDTE